MDRKVLRTRSGPTAVRWWLWQVLAAFFGAVLLVMMSVPADPASAHTYLAASAPTDGATVEEVPRQVKLDFTEQVELEFASVTVSVSDGPAYGALIETKGKSLVVRIPPGAAAGQSDGEPSLWKIAYRVTASDGHPVNETLSFTVAPGSAAADTGPVTAPANGLDSEVWAVEDRPRQTPRGWLLVLGSLTLVTILTVVSIHRRRSRGAPQ